MGELAHARPLRREERALLEFLLAADFPGKEILASQSANLEVVRECDCGCGTVNFRGAESAPQASVREPIPVEAYGVGVEVLLFVRGGYLRSLEVVHHGDPVSASYPAVEKLHLWIPGTPR